MPISEAKQRANKKYNDSHYKPISIKIKNDLKDTIDRVSAEKNLSIASYCRLCIEYCINNNIDISNNSDKG